MKNIIQKTIMATVFTVALSSDGFSVLAANSTATENNSGYTIGTNSDSTNDYNAVLDALYNGTPPVTPSQTIPTTVNNNMSTGTAISDSINAATPTASPIPMHPPLYPYEVRSVEENGAQWVLKSYELQLHESPESIPCEGFERNGWRYELTDIVKQDNVSMDMKEHTEIITTESATNNVTEILKLLSPTIDYISEDGYSGVLALDISSVSVKEAGTQTSRFTASATREYPYLSANDTALVPKSITESGHTLTLADVTWKATHTETIDHNALPESYTAIATYTRIGTRISVTGYTTTAEYKGTITKLLTDKTMYTAYFAGSEIAPLSPDNLLPQDSNAFTVANILPAALGITVGAGILGGAAFFLFFRRNVKVHNLADGKYSPIGKTRLSTRTPIINLTSFAAKAMTSSFILVLDRLTARSLAERTVTINYGDKSLQHIVVYDGGEYQIEVDF